MQEFTYLHGSSSNSPIEDDILNAMPNQFHHGNGWHDAGCFKSARSGLLKLNSVLDVIHTKKCSYYVMVILLSFQGPNSFTHLHFSSNLTPNGF